MLPAGMVNPLVLLLALATAGEGRTVNSTEDWTLGCLDEWGDFVDWYVLYKIPVPVPGTGKEIIDDGLGYLYYTSQFTEPHWEISERRISDPLSIPGLTLHPIYDNPKRDSLTYAFYNNDHPSCSSKPDKNKGHTKGVVAFEGDRGFWMVHSVPHFPPSPVMGQYSYAENGMKNGQSFLCVSLSSSKIEAVAKQLCYNEAHFYSTQVSETLKTLYPRMASVIGGQCSADDTTSVQHLHENEAQMPIFSYAKTKDFGKDLYLDLVASELKVNLFTETWQNGSPPKLPSACEPDHGVANVLVTKIDDRIFQSSKDHSKWAISEAEPYAVCIGDINRMESQKKRGGGAICLIGNVNLWRSYLDLVLVYQACPQPTTIPPKIGDRMVDGEHDLWLQ